MEEREFSSPVCYLDLDLAPPTAPERSIQGPSSPVETPAASVAAPHLRFAVACTVDD
jgi:hypothetical protein